MGIPLPLSRTRVFGWVPGETLSLTLPVRVGAVTSPPSTAVVRGMDRVMFRSLPVRVKAQGLVDQLLVLSTTTSVELTF